MELDESLFDFEEEQRKAQERANDQVISDMIKEREKGSLGDRIEAEELKYRRYIKAMENGARLTTQRGSNFISKSEDSNGIMISDRVAEYLLANLKLKEIRSNSVLGTCDYVLDKTTLKENQKIWKWTIEQAQAQVDDAINKFGRIGGGLYDELDHYGFYVDSNNKVQLKVPAKKKLKENYNNEFTIEINNEIYCDDNGEAYHFDSYIDAQEFIEENELENASIVRQHGKAKYEETLTKLTEAFTINDFEDIDINILYKLIKKSDFFSGYKDIKIISDNRLHLYINDTDAIEIWIKEHDDHYNISKHLSFYLSYEDEEPYDIVPNEINDIYKAIQIMLKKHLQNKNIDPNNITMPEELKDILTDEILRSDKFDKIFDKHLMKYVLPIPFDDTFIAYNLATDIDKNNFIKDIKTEFNINNPSKEELLKRRDVLEDVLQAMEARHDPDEREDIQEVKDEIAEINSKLNLTESLNEDLNQEELSDNGLATVINTLIKDEWDAIQAYNDAIVTFETEGKNDLVQVLQDILNEENLHVGQLETLLEQVSGSANSIDAGKAEAEVQLTQNESTENTIEDEEDPEEGMHY
jgi:hypothetical protein